MTSVKYSEFKGDLNQYFTFFLFINTVYGHIFYQSIDARKLQAYSQISKWTYCQLLFTQFYWKYFHRSTAAAFGCGLLMFKIHCKGANPLEGKSVWDDCWVGISLQHLLRVWPCGFKLLSMPSNWPLCFNRGLTKHFPPFQHKIYGVSCHVATLMIAKAKDSDNSMKAWK